MVPPAATIEAPAASSPLAPPLFDAGATLEDEVLAIWRDLRDDGRADCPLCGGPMSADDGCADCGAELS